MWRKDPDGLITIKLRLYSIASIVWCSISCEYFSNTFNKIYCILFQLSLVSSPLIFRLPLRTEYILIDSAVYYLVWCPCYDFFGSKLIVLPCPIWLLMFVSCHSHGIINCKHRLFYIWRNRNLLFLSAADYVRTSNLTWKSYWCICKISTSCLFLYPISQRNYSWGKTLILISSNANIYLEDDEDGIVLIVVELNWILHIFQFK